MQNHILKTSNNWDELKSKISKLSPKEKGDIFEDLTKYFLILHPTYATKLKHVWLYREIPQKIKKQLRLPDKDQGIDLIAQTIEGEFWAIQCKYHEDETRSLTWREVSTFAGLSFSVCKYISFGLICTNAERFTKVLKHQDNIGFCSSDVWRSLDKEFFKILHALISKRPKLPKLFSPRIHQKRAIRNALKHYKKEKNTRGKLIMPCGTGKSLTAYWIAEALKAKTIIIAVPSLSLISQTLQVWLRQVIAAKNKVDWICVCSDTTVGKIEKDDILLHTQDLGIPCVTDINEIVKWHKKSPKNSTRIVFATYQSGKVIAKASQILRIKFDLGVMDEAHKTVGQKGKLFSYLLNDENISIKHRLFMTATERRYAGNSEEILSMDNPNIYGETFELLTFKEALSVKPKILSDYQILTIFVNKAEVSELIKKNVFVLPDKGKWSEEVEAETLVSVVALRKAIKKYPIKHAISFHQSIRRAEVYKENQESFSKHFKSYGNLDSFHVSGAIPTGVRQKIISEFENSKKALITNARCLTEGVDVPNIDCVLFADPRRSTIDIVQAVGRALRPSPNKKYGYIIVPVLLDRELDKTKIEDTSAFNAVLTTLRALASNDERVVEYFRLISQGKRPSSGTAINIEIDEKYAKHINIDDFIENVNLKCWHKLAKLSWRPFEEARKYVRSLHIKNHEEWRKFLKNKLKEKGKRPIDIPSHPQQIYKNIGWKGFKNWLGTEINYKTYEDAKLFTTKLKLKSSEEWYQYCQGKMPDKPELPLDIPKTPKRTYKNKGWKGFADWLGTSFWSYTKARAFVRKLGLKSSEDWFKYCREGIPGKPKLPSNIPKNPRGVYENDGWKGFKDWLGNTIAYRSYKEAKLFVHKLGLNSATDWKKYIQKRTSKKNVLPIDIPRDPYAYYKENGWKGWSDWLGTTIIYKPYKEAVAFAQKLKLKSKEEWHKYCKGEMPHKTALPRSIPKTPDRIYGEHGWANWKTWIGKKDKGYLDYNEARAFVHKLKLKSQRDWFTYCRKGIPGKPKLPSNIYMNPYGGYKNKGWKNWPDWLGKKEEEQ